MAKKGVQKPSSRLKCGNAAPEIAVCTALNSFNILSEYRRLDGPRSHVSG